MAIEYPAFATCPKGLEALLFDELTQLGARAAKETLGGVSFGASTQVLYRICLWSRLANRVLLQLLVQPCGHVDRLYELARKVDWEEHMTADTTFAVEYSGDLRGVRHSHFGALKVKDAVVDYFRDKTGSRPSVDTRAPQFSINARVHKGNLTIALDLSGSSLHRRGYREEGGKAPLKENLAAALLLRADWPGIASRGGALLDPMCGSGTLLIEGAMMFGRIAPGLMRRHWGFDHWQCHIPKLWRDEVEAAKDQKAAALLRQWPEIRGYDADARAVQIAETNIEKAGLAGRVRVLRKELRQFTPPTHADITPGLIITNPPYGERLGEASALTHLYRHLGERLRSEFSGWEAGVFTGNPDLGKRMGLRARKSYQLFNGPIASKLLMFSVDEHYFVDAPPPPLATAGAVETSLSTEALSEGAQMLANRLRKNLKGLDKWAEREKISCYRVYDADLPEYAVAIDRYADWLHIAEYAAPKKMDEATVERRLLEAISAAMQIMAVPRERTVVKERRRQRGQAQYERVNQRSELLTVREGDVRLLVNLHDYLDTGLFLDHRKVRLDIAANAKGTRFLNLFCYTATASVHAAVGGARWTDSVDLSQTYLGWARRNLALNGLSEDRHRLHRADVREWLAACEQRYDLILLDPPTFSNSKKMTGVLDIQRDHVDLIDQSMRCLDRDGLLIFSNNHQRFQLDPGLSERYAVEERTRWSMDKDFQYSNPNRVNRIHQCWFLRHR